MRPHRLEKLASTIRFVVSDAIANKLSDPRISRFASVTRVDVVADLSLARVYVSVMGTPGEQRRTFRALQHAAGHVQRLLARQLQTRQCPEVRFVLDPSLKVAAQTMQMLKESGAGGAPEAEWGASDSDEPLGAEPGVPGSDDIDSGEESAAAETPP
ncbi:MAG TPA: 30S ribosome-binding factor RbfA [Phycisphaerae bacterium]|jgi:ribosome-binding factor A